MKGLPTSFKSSTCFRNIPHRSIFNALCLYCSFSTSTRPTEHSKEHEKPYKHVPTHAASSFLRTTTPPNMQEALEPVSDHIALRDLDPDLAEAVYDEGLAELVVIDGRVTNEIGRVGSAEDESPPEVAASNELHPDMRAADDSFHNRGALNETVSDAGESERVSVVHEAESISPHESHSYTNSHEPGSTELFPSVDPDAEPQNLAVSQ